VLFLDEAPEFAASVLDVLRQPMESGSITIHRARHTARFPSRFQLVMAANPCPCGQYGAPDGECTCAPTVRRRYLARISGPLMDRVDVRLTMRCVTAAQLRLAGEQRRLTTEEARRRVGRARAAAAARLRDTEWNTNGEVSGTWLRDRARLHGRALTASIDRALERGTITMRGYDRVLRLAWTIADVAGRDAPVPDDVGTALYMRGGVPA
jgi:magnesium chelatase family protein